MKSAIFAVATILVTLASISSVEAGYLKLTPGQLVQRSESEYALTINLENHDVSALMIAWQLVCDIVPRTPESAGLQFSSNAQPSNYIFENNTWGAVASDSSTPIHLMVADTANSPVAVPATGATLLTIGFDTSHAVGVFDMVLVSTGQVSSAWLTDSWESLAWNVNGSPSNVLTTLAFPAPEPGFLALAMPALAAVGIVLARHRRSSYAGQ